MLPVLHIFDPIFLTVFVSVGFAFIGSARNLGASSGAVLP
jgi:hypothetical protein